MTNPLRHLHAIEQLQAEARELRKQAEKAAERGAYTASQNLYKRAQAIHTKALRIVKESIINTELRHTKGAQ